MKLEFPHVGDSSPIIGGPSFLPAEGHLLKPPLIGEIPPEPPHTLFPESPHTRGLLPESSPDGDQLPEPLPDESQAFGTPREPLEASRERGYLPESPPSGGQSSLLAGSHSFEPSHVGGYLPESLRVEEPAYQPPCVKGQSALLSPSGGQLLNSPLARVQSLLPAGGQFFLLAGSQALEDFPTGGHLLEPARVGSTAPEFPHVGGQLPDSPHIEGHLLELLPGGGQLRVPSHVGGLIPPCAQSHPLKLPR